MSQNPTIFKMETTQITMEQQTNNNLKTTIMENLKPSTEATNLEECSITFGQQGEAIIVINKKGFIYKGQLIEDAGEVYNLFKSFLEQSLIK